MLLNALKKATVSAVALSFVWSYAANAAEMTKVGPVEGEVDIIAWAGYIENGSDDKNYDWVTDFEKQTGCKVNVKVAGTSDEMVSLMNAGGFDLVTASGDASLRLIAGKTVQPSTSISSPTGRPSISACRTAPGIRSTASTTARPTSGARTC